MRTNVRGVFLWLQAALPSLKEAAAAGGGAQVVVTSSVAGERAFGQAAAYCASKFAVNALVLSLREELKADHPRVKARSRGRSATWRPRAPMRRSPPRRLRRTRRRAW